MTVLSRLRRPALAAVAVVSVLGLAHAGTAATTATSATAPTYDVYTAPAGLAQDAGEPSLGVDPKTGAAMFQAFTQTAKVTFDDRTSPATATWSDVSYAGAVTSLDPILHTDRATGKTYSSQLLAACSIGSTTTDDGATWTPSTGCGIGTVFDHQTVGAGAYPASLSVLSNPLNAGRAWYYCAQVDVAASCARSDDGGVTFGPAVKTHDALLDGCAGLHGHLRVAPDGTTYLPNFDCNGTVANSVSQDGGLTWTVKPVTGSTTQDESDPSTAVGAKGTVYTGWEDGASDAVGSTPKIAVSTDKGTTWSTPVDVGTAFGIKNVQFPEVIAGDDDRAAFAFLGTTTGGSDQAAGFTGVWHLYVATTYDAGKTWTTVDATPTDPVQRGCIWLAGGSSNCRNLLDFNDIDVDAAGRVLVGYADGCVRACVTTPQTDYATTAGDYREDVGTIARQASGLGLFAANDPAAPVATATATAAPSPSATASGKGKGGKKP
ncbi:MAG: exo-alpha-sialidase [Frankiales bacterium]|nr:exo-alpha-sialidase [Frankiales bacterium]